MISGRSSVVIVESQPIMRMALGNALLSDGWNVLAEVADSHDVLQTASILTPDLVLFSVNTPSLKDFENLFALHQAFPNILIAALITGEFQWHFSAAENYGADLVLTKSTKRSELLAALNGIMKKKIYPASVQMN